MRAAACTASHHIRPISTPQILLFLIRAVVEVVWICSFRFQGQSHKMSSERQKGIKSPCTQTQEL